MSQTPSELKYASSHAGARLAKFKLPSRIWIHDEPLPLGATGKVQKKELKRFYESQLEHGGG